MCIFKNILGLLTCYVLNFLEDRRNMSSFINRIAHFELKSLKIENAKHFLSKLENM